MKLHDNAEWLNTQYIINQLNLKQVAILANVNQGTIRNRLKKFNIPIRTSQQGIKLYRIKNNTIGLHEDPNWLYEQYVINKLSTRDIEKLANVSRSVIRHNLKRFNISTRSISDGLFIKQDQINTSVQKYWQDPEKHQQQSETMIRVQSLRKPELSASAKLNWQNNREAIVAGIIRVHSTPEARQQSADNTRRLWTIAEYRDKITSTKASPEYLAQNTARSIKISKAITDLITNGKLQIHTNYKHGYYESSKAGRLHYRSSWELEYFQYLDNNIDVLEYNVEPLYIPYELNGITRNYIPDILVYYIDGHLELIEIKPSNMLSQPKNAAKITAGQSHCELLDVSYIVITEHELRALGIKV